MFHAKFHNIRIISYVGEDFRRYMDMLDILVILPEIFI